jgi:hypothetical protein
LFKFGSDIKAVRRFDLGTVRTFLASLPDHCRLHALLALNCGCTQVDIAALRKDQLADGCITRKRIKTERIADVPTVRYRLWASTLALLNKFPSPHPTLLLTSSTGTPLVRKEYDADGKVKQYDGVSQQWKRCKERMTKELKKLQAEGKVNKDADMVWIRLKDFRSIAATAIRSSKQ